jgi:hypothetical protein
MTKAVPKYEPREMSIGDAVSDAFSALESLGEEMRESYDNTPENFQQSGVGEARGEAADALENLSEPSVPAELEEIKVSWSVPVLSPSKARKQSRSDRRYEATATLQAVISVLEDIRDYEPELDAEGAVVGERLYSEDQVSEADSFLDEVQNLIDEAEAVEFPGMYG